MKYLNKISRNEERKRKKNQINKTKRMGMIIQMEMKMIFSHKNIGRKNISGFKNLFRNNETVYQNRSKYG